MQHDDNEYYLHMSVENKKSARGSIFIDYRNDRELNKFKDRSLYETDVQLDGDDRIITLVTCSYETRNSRTIVHAKLI